MNLKHAILLFIVGLSFMTCSVEQDKGHKDSRHTDNFPHVKISTSPELWRHTDSVLVTLRPTVSMQEIEGDFPFISAERSIAYFTTLKSGPETVISWKPDSLPLLDTASRYIELSAIFRHKEKDIAFETRERYWIKESNAGKHFLARDESFYSIEHCPCGTKSPSNSPSRDAALSFMRSIIDSSN